MKKTVSGFCLLRAEEYGTCVCGEVLSKIIQRMVRDVEGEEIPCILTISIDTISPTVEVRVQGKTSERTKEFPSWKDYEEAE